MSRFEDYDGYLLDDNKPGNDLLHNLRERSRQAKIGRIVGLLGQLTPAQLDAIETQLRGYEDVAVNQTGDDED